MRLVNSFLLWFLWTLFLALIAVFLFYYPWENKNNKQSIKNVTNVYAFTQPNQLAETVKKDIYRVYVPNSFGKTVSVIDPLTYKVIGKFVSGKNPQHITPSYDLKKLFVLNDLDNSLTPINATTGKVEANIPVDDPYNMYFTPDGRFAIVVQEEGKLLAFRDAHSLQLIDTVPVTCAGVNHMDFTADGRYAVLSCEFSGSLIRLDVNKRKVMSYLSLNSCLKRHSMPQDVRLSPDGRLFYIADMMLDGVHLVDAQQFKLLGFIATGKGAHSIYPSRNGRYFYVGDRGCHSATICKRKGPGDIAVIDTQRQKLVAVWPIPGGGSPDMGNLTPDGKELWLAGRYDGVVYVFNTETGKLTHRIKVGAGPHGLTVWPQPGRYSLGHTGNMR